MTIYQKSVQQEREEALKIGKVEGIAEGSTNTMYSVALLLSRKDNCSFESVLEKLEVSEADMPIYLERYRRENCDNA